MLAVSGRGRSLLVNRAALEQLTADELEVACAHELCRDAFRHSSKILAMGFAVSLVQYALIAWIAAAWTHWQYGPIGYGDWPASSIAAVMFAFAVSNVPCDRAKRWSAGRLLRQSDRLALRCARSDATFVSAFTKLADVSTYDAYLHAPWNIDSFYRLTPEDRLARAKR